MYIFVYHIIKNRGTGPYYSLRHADSRKYFSGLFLTQNRREAHMFYLLRQLRRISSFCWEKGNFIMINEFKYGETWKIWPSPLSFSHYSTFKAKITWVICSCTGKGSFKFDQHRNNGCYSDKGLGPLSFSGKPGVYLELDFVHPCNSRFSRSQY